MGIMVAEITPKSDLLLQDESAFAEFYNSHESGLRAYVGVRILQRSVIADLFQEIFLRFLIQIKKIPTDYPERYLFTCAKHVILDYLRKQGRRKELFEKVARPILDARYKDGKSATPPQAAEAAEDAKALQQALADLPVEQAEIVILRACEDFSFQEISGLLGIPYNTAVSRYRYGLKKLREPMT